MRDFGNLSLKEKHEDSFVDVLKTIRSFEKGRSSRKLRARLFLILHDVVPRNGITTMKSFFGTVVTGVLFSKILLKNARTCRLISKDNHSSPRSSSSFRPQCVRNRMSRRFGRHDVEGLRSILSCMLLARKNQS